MIISENRLARRIAEDRYEIPANTPLDQIPGVDRLAELVPESVARECQVFPVHENNGILFLASSTASDLMLEDKLRFILGRDVRLIQHPANKIFQSLDAQYGLVCGETADSMLQEFCDKAIDFCEAETCEELPRHRLVRETDTLCEPQDRIYALQAARLRCRPPKGHCDPVILRRGIMSTTVGEGERAIVYQRNGNIEVVQGPKRIHAWFARVEPMQRYVAGPSEYLRIRYRSGQEETSPGPGEVWVDPRVHESVKVEDCLVLAAKEAVVVYGKPGNEPSEADTSRRIVEGPGMFVPRPGEWLHHFSWHASKGGSRGVEKQPGGLQFEKMLLMPDQMYHDVHDVRTADDAVLTIRLMIFFEIVDIERMLDTTRDPIGDFINAATSDVVEFTVKHSFDEFKQRTDRLNELETYSQLLHRAQQCGYRIHNVVYRGYGAPESLQTMHDEAIQSRTKLALEKETERQAQELEDYKLKCQMERAEERRKETLGEVRHDIEIKQEQSSSEIARKRQEQAFREETLKTQRELELELQSAADAQQAAHLSALGQLGVDLTQYLTKGSADQVIELRGNDHARPHLHLN